MKKKKKPPHSPPTSQCEASHWDELPLDFRVLSTAGSKLPALAGSEMCSGLVGLPGEAQPSPAASRS